MAFEYFPERALVAEDFRLARRRAGLQAIVSRLTGRSAELLSYEEVRQKLRGRETSSRTLQDIPLKSVVGSVGRYKEFTRDFLPRKSVVADRWIRVKLAMIGSTGVPPIEVYRIGKVYFVQDGNHRVSVAREIGLTHLEAYVTKVTTRVSLLPDTQPEDLIIQAEYDDFLERTRQDQLRPEAELRLTVSGRYPILLEHIDVHRYYLGLNCSCEVPYANAFTSWYDTVYMPVVRVIRERGLLRDFPERTETDLYLWISQHRAELEQALHWRISTDKAARDLRPKQASIRPAQQRLLNMLSQDKGVTRSPPRKENIPQEWPNRGGRVVDDLLVAVDGKESGWNALDQALSVACREDARVLGLHVVATDANRSNKQLKSLAAQFEQNCRIAGIMGQLAVEVGEPTDVICQRARWADLVVVGRPPPATRGRQTGLGLAFRTLLRSCPRPVLAVPEAITASQRALLAYDGSPKSEEALYVASYLASWWSHSLTVVTVGENLAKASKIQAPVRSYLEQHGILGEMVFGKGPVAETILRETEARASDIIIMGGYGFSPLVKAVLGSTVDEVLRMSRRPVFVLT